MGICVRIKKVDVTDNVLIRKDAELLIKFVVEMVVIKLVPGEYFEGEVVEFGE